MFETPVNPGKHAKHAYIVPEGGSLKVLVDADGDVSVYLIETGHIGNYEDPYRAFLPIALSEGKSGPCLLEGMGLPPGKKVPTRRCPFTEISVPLG